MRGTFLGFWLRWALLATVVVGVAQSPRTVAAQPVTPAVLAYLELSAQELLHFAWQEASAAPIVISMGPHADDRVVYRGTPPHGLLLGPGRYWIWSAQRSGTMKITGRRV